MRALTPETWKAFDELVARNGGVWGGCWCMGFHPKTERIEGVENLHRHEKERRVCAGETHSALVFDQDLCVGWCQYGSPQELPRIKSRAAYEVDLKDLPDWRITCFYVDKKYRKRGVADVALAGALELIAAEGGGTVESYPEDTAGRKTSSSFLHNGTLAMFERHGFQRQRKIAMHRWVVIKKF